VKNKIKIIFLLLILALFCISLIRACSPQSVTRSLGGTVEIVLPTNQKLVTATWKNGDIWYLVRPMKPGEVPEICEFIESSTLGVMQGKVVFKERLK
jgi:hypothetical protein